MKLTAEQLAINISTDLANGVVDQQRIIDIQEYGRQCAEQTLKYAAENAKMIYHCGYSKKNTYTSYHQQGADNIQIAKDSILNTPIQTP